MTSLYWDGPLLANANCSPLGVHHRAIRPVDLVDAKYEMANILLTIGRITRYKHWLHWHVPVGSLETVAGRPIIMIVLGTDEGEVLKGILVERICDQVAHACTYHILPGGLEAVSVNLPGLNVRQLLLTFFTRNIHSTKLVQTVV